VKIGARDYGMNLESIDPDMILGFRVGHSPDGTFIVLQFATDRAGLVALALPQSMFATFMSELNAIVKLAEVAMSRN
jgi:hypothetical protein